MNRIITYILIAIAIVSCTQTKKSDLAFKTFNEGVTFSLDALEEYNKGNFEKSDELNRKAIEKFHETLKIDSLHKAAPSALGHSYYLIGNSKEGIYWFEKSIALDSSSAPNFREYGLCKVNLGDLQGAKIAFEKAFKLDNGNEIKNITVLDLSDIGIRAFDYGAEYERQGEKEKGLEYKRFAVAVLGTAFTIDTTNIETIKRITEYTEALGDKQTALYFRNKIK
jgi:tetratricopeptide (TPR) repeat protein